MKLKKMNHVIMILLLFTLILGQSSLAFAAGKPAPVVRSAIDITTTGFSVTIPEDTIYAFSVNLTSSIPNFSWAITPLDPSLTYSLNTVQIKTSKRSTSYLQTANFVYTPVDDDTAKKPSFVISASDGGTVNQDRITVTFDVTPVVEQVTFDYVVLGDSIPNGVSHEYNASGEIIPSYTDKLYDYFLSSGKYDVVNYLDYSVSGYNSVDVLNQLSNPAIYEAIDNAEYISLCVGANDIMDAAARKTGYILWIIPFEYIDFYDINWSVADSGRQNFETYYSTLIEQIRVINSEAEIVVTNIYNPYNEYDSSNYTGKIGDEYINARVDSYLWNDAPSKLGVNTIINNLSSLYNYQIINIYSTFESNYTDSKGDVTGFYGLNPISGIDIKDPHPDNNGQQMIYELHLNAMNLSQ